MPDVISYADYQFCAAEVVADIGERVGSYAVGRVEVMPYPSPPPKVRQIVLAQLPDLVVARTAAGTLAAATEPRLSDDVFSYRLASLPPGWAFRSPKNAYRRMIDVAKCQLIEGDAQALIKADVRNYYPSIPDEHLMKALADWGCNARLASMILRIVTDIRDRAQVTGLPLGLDLSAVIANAFLLPVDRSIEATGVKYVRYSDDYLLLGSSLDQVLTALSEAETALGGIGLELNQDKLLIVDGKEASLAALNDPVLDYVVASSRGKSADAGTLHDLFDNEVAGAEAPLRGRFRFVIGGLIAGNDPYGTHALAESRALVAVDPQYSCRYLGAAIRMQDVRDGVLSLLAQQPNDSRDAVDLHLLKACARSPWGGSDASIFEAIAHDRSVRAPIRSWAWRCIRRSPRWKSATTMECALAERNPLVQRAIVATLKGTITEWEVRRFSEVLEDGVPAKTVTCPWVLAA